MQISSAGPAKYYISHTWVKLSLNRPITGPGGSWTLRLPNYKATGTMR